MTEENQNKDFHWTAHMFCENRIPCEPSLSDEDVKDIQEINNTVFVPDAMDMRLQKNDYIVLVQRVLVEYIPALEPFKDFVVNHIPHKYSKETKKATNHVCQNQTLHFSFFFNT